MTPSVNQVLSRVKYLGTRRMGAKPYWYLMGRFRAVPAVTSECKGLAESMASGAQVVELLDQLGVLRPDSVTLHIGSGLGRVEAHLRHRVERCYGVDISPSMVRRARRNVPYENVEFRETDGNGLHEWPDGYFGLVYSFLVFQHLPRETFRSYVGDARRKLAPGGKFVFQIMVDETGSQPDPPASHPYGLRYYRRRQVEDILSDAGFTVECRMTLDGTPDDASAALADVVFCAGVGQ